MRGKCMLLPYPELDRLVSPPSRKPPRLAVIGETIEAKDLNFKTVWEILLLANRISSAKRKEAFSIRIRKQTVLDFARYVLQREAPFGQSLDVFLRCIQSYVATWDLNPPKKRWFLIVD